MEAEITKIDGGGETIYEVHFFDGRAISVVVRLTEDELQALMDLTVGTLTDEEEEDGK